MESESIWSRAVMSLDFDGLEASNRIICSITGPGTMTNECQQSYVLILYQKAVSCILLMELL